MAETRIVKGPFNNYVDKMRGEGVKNCPRRGVVKKRQSSVLVFVECLLIKNHFCKANFTLKYGPLTSPVTLSELRKHQKIFSMANLVCPYPPKKTIISGGTVFAVFDLGQIAYQGPVPNQLTLVSFTL